MKLVVSALAGASLLLLAIVPADAAKKKSTRVAGPNEHQLSCLKQAGAWLDPATKRWVFATTERDGMGRIDQFKMCLTKGDRGKARAMGVYERASNPGSDQR